MPLKSNSFKTIWRLAPSLDSNERIGVALESAYQLSQSSPALIRQGLAEAIILAESGSVPTGGVVSVIADGTLTYYELKDSGDSGSRPNESVSTIHVGEDGLYLSLLSVDGSGDAAFNQWGG